MFQPIPLEIFEARTGIKKSDWMRNWRDATAIASLRQITAEGIEVMPRDYLSKLLRHVYLVGSHNVRIYEQCAADTMRIDASALAVGQTFVERKKYQAFLETFPATFSRFCLTKGFAKCTALIILGRMSDGTNAIAHYVPPIVEEHGGRLCLLDGIHRSFIARGIGTTIEAIVVWGVRAPFPCEPRDWSCVHPVDEKPPEEERFFDLKPELFRDLKAIGIDG